MEIIEVSVKETMPIRKTVFTDEQGFKEEIEPVDLIETTKHLVLVVEGKNVATARVLDNCSYYKVTRVATLKKYRHKGYGKLLMEYIVQNFTDKNIHLNSQDHAVPFYEKVGFEVHGEMFLEENYPHYLMVYIKS